MSEPKSAGFVFRPLYLLLLALPLALVLNYATGAGPVWVFLASGIAIIPLAGLMGEATESLAERLGPTIGGLLNATFGNAAELIIAILALRNNEHELVKASITGSIIGNVLLVLGLSIVCGGFFHPRQTFNRTSASLGATLLALASIGLVIPTIYYYLTQNQTVNTRQLEYLSEEIAVVLAVVYVLSLIFTLWTHRKLLASDEADAEGHDEAVWPAWVAALVLLVATAGVALMSELLVHSVTGAAASLGMTHVFVGVIVIAIIGNAAEHSTAVLMAMKNKMDLALTVAVGSSIQIALFVAPVLVLAGYLMDRPLDLHFTLMEVVAVVIAIAVMTLVSQDGETHWMEGVLLLAVYLILGLAFYHLPETATAAVHPH